MNGLLDTSILIEFYRKQKKESTLFWKMVRQGYSFSVSAITEYEILVGSGGIQDEYWESLFSNMDRLPVNSGIIRTSVDIYRTLKIKNDILNIPDLLIGCTALYYNTPIATLNSKHFNRIPGLELLDLNG